MDTSSSPHILRPRFKGVVISASGNKTLVVKVERMVRHPLYGKLYRRTRKFKVHDENNQFHQGDVVEFVQCRPLSKEKRWRVLFQTPMTLKQ